MKKIAKYFVNVRKEMKKVRWPKKKEMVKYSVATLSLIVFVMLFFVATDAILGVIVKVFN